jgi:hypothetical protein
LVFKPVTHPVVALAESAVIPEGGLLVGESSWHASFKHLYSPGGVSIWQVKDALAFSPFFFESGLSVDADGAPNAYAPAGVKGTLDWLADAGHPAKKAGPSTPAVKADWWGLDTVSGRSDGTPIVQSGVAPQQPYAGFYISHVALVDGRYHEGDVRRNVDATQIPYIALPPRHLHGTGLRIGDLALLVNGSNGRFTFAIYADTKYKPNFGEVSICAAGALGAPTSARHGSLPRGIITLVFPRSGRGQGRIPDAATIATAGRATLQQFAWLGDPSGTLATAYPEYPLFAQALTRAGYRPAPVGDFSVSPSARGMA